MANGKTTGSNDEDLLDVHSLLGLDHAARKVRLGVRRRLGGRGRQTAGAAQKVALLNKLFGLDL